MATAKSFHPNAPQSIGWAMGRAFGIAIPATVLLSAVLAVGFAVALDGCSGRGNKTEIRASRVNAPEPVATNPHAAAAPAKSSAPPKRHLP